MAVWLEMARIVLGGPCARALRRLASAAPLPLSCPGALLYGSARALVRAARDAAGALACSLRSALNLSVLFGIFPSGSAAWRSDASSASSARFAHPARGGFPHAGGEIRFGISGKACASARAGGVRGGLGLRRRASAPSLRA